MSPFFSHEKYCFFFLPIRAPMFEPLLDLKGIKVVDPDRTLAFVKLVVALTKRRNKKSLVSSLKYGGQFSLNSVQRKRTN